MTTRLRTNDLACGSCVAGLEKMLKRIQGVEDARVRFPSGLIEVRHDARVNASALIRAIRAAGYGASASVL